MKKLIINTLTTSILIASITNFEYKIPQSFKQFSEIEVFLYKSDGLKSKINGKKFLTLSWRRH